MFTFNVYDWSSVEKVYLGVVRARMFSDAEKAAREKWPNAKIYLRMCM